LAAGDAGFDDGPLVLDRNIPEQGEVHRVLGMISNPQLEGRASHNVV
jgi:hypothetical protein